MTAPEGLHERGAALWASLGQKAGTPAGDLALEASRTADRLDELDRIIHGKGVLNLLSFRLSLNFTEGDERTVNVKVGFADVMAEARQQQMAFKQRARRALPPVTDMTTSCRPAPPARV